MASPRLSHLLAVAITLSRTKTSAEIRALIRQMSRANPLWGAPRIHGELLKLGIDVSQATVGRHLPRRPKAPSPTWRSFLRNHMTVIVAVDMFAVATATFRLLYAVIVLDHRRRRVVHFEVTQNPTQVWLAQHITEAFPRDTAPRYLLRDRDTSYGLRFQKRVRAMGIEEVLTAPRSPWQSPYVERIIGSIRRECLDHVIIFNEAHLRRVLSCYFRYYHESRTHLSLNKDCPAPRRTQPPSAGKIVAFPDIIIATNVARPEPRQSIGRGCVSEIRPFSTPSAAAHIAPVVRPSRGRQVRLLRMNGLRDPIDL